MAKQRIVDPTRNLRSLHPFEIWLELHRHKVYVKLSDGVDSYLTTEELCARMFSNWEDLDLVQRSDVATAKMTQPLNLMTRLRTIARDHSFPYRNLLNKWRLTEDPYASDYTTERYIELMHHSLEESWADYTGKTARHLRILEKYS
jgi:hypothetical protein